MANKLSKKDFHYYLAIDGEYYRRYAPLFKGEDILFSIAFLDKTEEKNQEFLDKLRKHQGHVMLDSGDFTNFNKPGTVTFDQWLDFVKKNKSVCHEYVQFDDLRSRARTIKYYEQAIRSGLDPLFVDHLFMRTRPEKIERIWKAKDKVCVSAFAKMRPHQESLPPSAHPRAKFEEAMKRAEDHDTMTHLLAVGSLKRFLPHMERIHSVDSAKWIKNPSFGKFSVLCFDEIEGIRVPSLKDYSFPSARVQSKPIPSELKAKFWDNPVRANHWEKLPRYKQREAISILHLKKYIKELKKFSPVELKKALAEKNGEVIRKMLEEDLQSSFEFPDFDPIEDGAQEIEVSSESGPKYFDMLYKSESDLEPISIEKIQDVTEYDPAQLSDAVLRDDFRIALAWHEQAVRNPDFKISDEKIRSLVVQILREAKRRGPEVFSFNPSGMTEQSRSLFLSAAHEAGLPDEQILKAADSIEPSMIATATTDELVLAHAEIHKSSYDSSHSQDSDKGGTLHSLIVDELTIRGVSHPQPPDNGLDEISRDFEVQKSTEDLMPVAHSGNIQGPPIRREDVLKYLKSFKLRAPFVHVVGGIATDSRTPGDVDILVSDDFCPIWMRDIIEFRIKRAMPPEIASRVHVLYDRARGPFTSNIELYDLVLERVNPHDEVKLMRNGEEEVKKDEITIDSVWSGAVSFADAIKIRDVYREKTFQTEAAESEAKDAVVAGRAFLMPKPTRSADPEEKQTIENLLRIVKLPAVVQKKYDGVRHQISVVGGRAKIVSEDGGDNTNRLPTVVQELLALGHDVVFDTEIETWEGRKHMPREVTTGYLNSLGPADDSKVVVNIFDVLSLDGRDLHKAPIEARLEALNGLEMGQSTMAVPSAALKLNRAPGVTVHSSAELERAARAIRLLPGSEGVVVKSFGSPYPLRLVTPDSWVKFHNAVVIKGIVTAKTRTLGNVWLYDWALLPGRDTPAEFKEVNGKQVVPVGQTFGTSIDADVGDSLDIEVETLNYSHTPSGVRLGGWVPRVLGITDRTFTVDQAVSAAKRQLVLQEKEEAEDGSIAYKLLRWFQWQADPYMEIPPEDDGPYRYVVQHHWRGRSVHSDFRIELRKKALLIGWTLNTQISGSVEDPVTSLTEAKATVAGPRMESVSKLNWHTGEWATREREGSSEPVTTEILSEEKAPEPFVWIDVEGKTRDPRPGEATPVGGTARYPGVFDIVDSGTIEYGSQKPWFHEYFPHGTGMNYRIIFRQLELGAIEKALEKYKDGSHLGIGISKAVLPPSEGEGRAYGGAQWFAMRPDDQTPYVLGKEAVEKDWMPPDGVSALPAAIRSQIPRDLRYWESIGAKAMAQRNALVQAISDGSVKLKMTAPYLASTRKAMDVDWVLQEQSWRGPVVIRTGPSGRIWYLRIGEGDRPLRTVKLYDSPLDNEQLSAMIYPERHSDAMNLEGAIAPGHWANETKETPSWVERLDGGKAVVLADNPDFLKLSIDGSTLKGVFTLTRNAPGPEWLWQRTSAGPEIQKIDVPVLKVESEKRLVTGIVLEPDTIDAHRDIVSREVIEKAAHRFMADYNDETQMGLMHRKFSDVGIEMVESWIAPGELTINGVRIKPGTWVMTVHVTKDDVWKEVKEGRLTGFSIGGIATVQ